MAATNGNGPEIITRQQAIALGLSRYFTGKRCKNGHVSPRNLRNYHCLECDREWTDFRYHSDPEYSAYIKGRAAFARGIRRELREADHGRD